jgi:hypothetical protein
MSDSDVGGVLFFVLFFWIMWTVLGGIAGHFRGRPGSGAAWGFLLGPIGIAVTLWVLADLRPHCEACVMAIPAGAIRCPYCGSQQSRVAVRKQESQVSGPIIVLVVACFFAFIGLVVALSVFASGDKLIGSIITLLCMLPVGWAIVNLRTSRSRNCVGRPVQSVGAKLVYEHRPESFQAPDPPKRQPPCAPNSSTTEKIRVACPCGAKFLAPASFVGRQAKCPKCGTVFVVE